MSTVSPVVPAAERQVLAPTGVLRVGLYAGSPTSYLEAGGGMPARGVGYLLGREFARSLAVPFEPVVYPRNAELLKAVGADEVDVVFTNATRERARSIHFCAPLLTLEKGVLVPRGSGARAIGDVTVEGSRVGFSAGSSTAVEFARIYGRPTLVAVASLPEAAVMLANASLDGFATNKAILFQLAEATDGARILEGTWGVEHLALGIPITRAAGLPCLQGFAAWAAQSGCLRDAVALSGLQGAKPYSNDRP